MAVIQPMSNNINGFSDDTHEIVTLIDSYRNFPSGVPVDTFLLACSGFRYTGFSDRVICSSCRVEIENLKPGDDADLAKFHKPNCPKRNLNNASSGPFTNQRRSCGVSKISAGDLLMNGLGGSHAYMPPYTSVVAAPLSDTNDVEPPARSGYDLSPLQNCSFESC